MQTGTVFVDSVLVGKRLRQVDPEKVGLLAQSMDEIGLQTPITIWATGPEQTEAHLVAGRHRLEAAKKLGWEEIDCIFTDLDGFERELWEIDENLVRADLSTEEKREHLKQRKVIWERREKQNQVAHRAPDGTFAKGNKKEKGFAADTAEKTGMSKSQINRLLADPKPQLRVVEVSEEDQEAMWLQQGMAWWDRGKAEWREEFLDQIDTPVFDKTGSA